MNIGPILLISPFVVAIFCGVLARFFLKRWIFLGLSVCVVLAAILLYAPYERFLISLALFPVDTGPNADLGFDMTAAFTSFALAIVAIIYLFFGLIGMLIGGAGQKAK